MRQEMRWERHFVPFTGKLSLLILLGLFIGLVGGWQIVDGMIDYNRIDPREPFSARLVRKECVREAPFPVHRFHVCRCSDGRFFDYRVYKAEFESYETGDTLRLFLTRNGSKIISEYNVREMAIRRRRHRHRSLPAARRGISAGRPCVDMAALPLQTLHE